jgi:hypothetical protein
VRHPDALVARIKGAALAGIPQKAISRLIEVPVRTVRNYVSGDSRSYVEPNREIGWRLKAWILGD